MPWTNFSKNRFGVLFAGSTIYAAFHTAAPGDGGANEFAGHGYSRGAVAPAQMTVNAAGVISTNAEIPVYTPNDDAAQDVRFITFWNMQAGGELLAYTDAEIADIAVPVNGQPVNIPAGTIINT